MYPVWFTLIFIFAFTRVEIAWSPWANCPSDPCSFCRIPCADGDWSPACSRFVFWFYHLGILHVELVSTPTHLCSSPCCFLQRGSRAFFTLGILAAHWAYCPSGWVRSPTFLLTSMLCFLQDLCSSAVFLFIVCFFAGDAWSPLGTLPNGLGSIPNILAD